MSARPVVAALGGDALLRRGEPADAATQRRNVARAVTALAPLAAGGPLVVTHGNGPQVGLLALQIVELGTIRLLLAAGTIVICVRGGGIPVTLAGGHMLNGVEAVMDKDLAAAQLAVALDARALLLLTDVTAVQDG